MLMKPAAWIARLMLILSVAVLAACFLAVGMQYPVILYLAAGAAALKATRRGVSLWSHGTARMAWVFDLLRQGMLGKTGLIMGRVGVAEKPSLGQGVRSLVNPRVGSEVACRMFLGSLYRSRWAAERMIRIYPFTHALTVAPAGKGKSVSVLVPNLLAYAGSCVVGDPKAELWSLTARHRQARLGQRIFVLDPGGLCREPGSQRRVKSDTFNPLDFIDPSASDFLDRCRDLANMLVIRTGEEREPHWNDAAEIVLTALIAFVCIEPNPQFRNLTTVRKLVSSRAKFAKAVAVMQQTEGYGGVIKSHGQLLTWFVERELGSVMTTVQRHTAWMDSPDVAACLSHTTFDPRLLRAGGCTVYLVLAHDKMTVWQGLMRTWLGCILRITTRGAASEHNPVLYLCDEAGNIGHMRALQDGITLMRGMGVRIWLFFQSLGQLQECYGKHASVILDNMDTQQYFGINSYATAEEISKKIGEQTILVKTDSGGDSYSWPVGSSTSEPQPGNRSINSGWSVAAQGRQVLKPEEILVLPEDIALVFHRNLPVIQAKLLRYYDAPEFARGGTGVQPGLGVGVMLASAAVLLLSLVLAAGVAGGPMPELSRLAGVIPGAPMKAGEDAARGWQFDLSGGYPLSYDLPPAQPPPPAYGRGRRPAYRPKP